MDSIMIQSMSNCAICGIQLNSFHEPLITACLHSICRSHTCVQGEDGTTSTTMPSSINKDGASDYIKKKIPKVSKLACSYCDGIIDRSGLSPNIILLEHLSKFGQPLDTPNALDTSPETAVTTRGTSTGKSCESIKQVAGSEGIKRGTSSKSMKQVPGSQCDVKTMCSSCQSSDYVVSFCPKCSGLLCSGCATRHHKLKPFRSHSLLGSNSNQAKAFDLLLLPPHQGITDQSTNSTHGSVTSVQSNSIRPSVQTISMNQTRSDQCNNDHGHNPTAMKPPIIPFWPSMIPSRPSMTPTIERQSNHSARRSRSSSLVTNSLVDTIINNSATNGLPVQTINHQLPVQATVHGQYQKMVAGESYLAGGQIVPIRKVLNPSTAQLISQSLISPANQLINPSDYPMPSKERSSHEEDKTEQRNLLSLINYFIRLTNEKLIADKNMLIIKQKQCMNRSEELKNRFKKFEIEEKFKIESTINKFFESKNEIMNEYFSSIRSTCNQRIQGQEFLVQRLNHIKGMIEGIKNSSINHQLTNQPLISQSSPIRPTMLPPGGNGFLTNASDGNPIKEISINQCINQCINPVLEREVVNVDRVKSLNGILSSTLDKLYKEYKKLSTTENTHSDLVVNFDIEKFIDSNDLLNELDSVLRSKEVSLSNCDDSFSNGSKSGSESPDKDASGGQTGINDSSRESSNSRGTTGLTNKSHGTSDNGHRSSNGDQSNLRQSNQQQSGQALVWVPSETVTNGHGSGTSSNSVPESSGISSPSGHLSIDLCKPSSNSSNGKVSIGQIEKASNRKFNDNGNENVKIIHDTNPLTPSVAIDNSGKQMNIKINLLPRKRSITSSSSDSGQRTQEQDNHKPEEKGKEKEKEKEKETGSNKVSGEETKETRNVSEINVSERSVGERNGNEGRKNGSTEKKRKNVEMNREYVEEKSEEKNGKEEESEDEQIILYRKKKKKGKKIMNNLQERLIKKMKKLPRVAASPTSIKSSSTVLSRSKNVSDPGTDGKNFPSKFNGSMPGQICSPQHEKVTKRVRSEESLHSEVSNSRESNPNVSNPNVSNSNVSNSRESNSEVSNSNVSKLRTEMDPRSSALPLLSPRCPPVRYIWKERKVKNEDTIACPMYGTKLDNRIPMNVGKLEKFDTMTGTVAEKKLHPVPMEEKSHQSSWEVERKSRKRVTEMPPLTLIKEELNRTPRMAAMKAIERITVQQRECMLVEAGSPVTVINPVTANSSSIKSPNTIPPKAISPNCNSPTRMVPSVSELIDKSSSIDEGRRHSFEVLSPPVSSKSNMSPPRELLLFPSNSSHATCLSSCHKIHTSGRMKTTSGQMKTTSGRMKTTSGQMTATSSLIKRRLSRNDVIESLSVLLSPSADRKNSDQIFDTDQETEVEEEGQFFGNDPLPQDGVHGKNDIGMEREGVIAGKVSSSSIQLNRSLDMEAEEEEDESDDQICPTCHQEDPPILNSNEFGIANEPVSWTACEICTLWYHDNCVPELRFKSFRGPFYKFICSSCQG